MSGDVGRVAVDIARATLVTEVRLRGSARSVRDRFPIGSDERQLAQGLLRVANAKVRAAVRDAHLAGCGTTELVRLVGVSRARIHQILVASRRHPAGGPDGRT